MISYRPIRDAEHGDGVTIEFAEHPLSPSLLLLVVSDTRAIDGTPDDLDPYAVAIEPDTVTIALDTTRAISLSGALSQWVATQVDLPPRHQRGPRKGRR